MTLTHVLQYAFATASSMQEVDRASTGSDVKSSALSELCVMCGDWVAGSNTTVAGTCLAAADVQALKRVSTDAKEHAHNKQMAVVVRALAANTPDGTKIQIEKASKLFRKAIQLHQDASPADRERRKCGPVTDEGQPTYCATAEPTMQSLREVAESSLKKFNEWTVENASQGVGHLKTANGVSDSLRWLMPGVTSNEERLENFSQQMSNGIARIPGNKCDHCGKLGQLQQCTRCGGVWYCSRACQRASWQARHRRECREQGVFRGGDLISEKAEALRQPVPSFHVLVKPATEKGEGWWWVDQRGVPMLPAGNAKLMHTSKMRLHPMVFTMPRTIGQGKTIQEHLHMVYDRANMQDLNLIAPLLGEGNGLGDLADMFPELLAEHERREAAETA